MFFGGRLTLNGGFFYDLFRLLFNAMLLNPFEIGLWLGVDTFLSSLEAVTIFFLEPEMERLAGTVFFESFLLATLFCSEF